MSFKHLVIVVILFSFTGTTGLRASGTEVSHYSNVESSDTRTIYNPLSGNNINENNRNQFQLLRESTELASDELTLFYLAPNGVTVMCPDAEIGDTGTVAGVEFTKRSRDQINDENAPTSCTSGITDMSDLFRGNPFPTFSTFSGDISHWDVSNVTSMASMFYYTSEFNGDLSSWDVSKVTDMGKMFESATAFDADISDWDVSSVTNMRSMFEGASKFNSDLSRWNVSKVIDMGRMFYQATAFNADLSGWDVSSVQFMNLMFSSGTNTSLFNSDLSGWNVANVKNMSGMFAGARNFNADLSGWNVANVTNMWIMFNRARSFNSDISGWDVGNVIQIASMFADATSFNQNLGAWNLSKLSSGSGFTQGLVDVFNNSGISTANYDATLQGWFDGGKMARNIFLGADGLTYCLSEAARQGLIDELGWTITGDILDCSVVEPPNPGFQRDTETAVVNVTNPVTGVVWMDRNLGASRAATSSTDAESYGDLYQWGRAADGHQKRTSPTTSTLSSTDTPGHGSFILALDSPFNWRSPQNINLWQGVDGINNPCPVGYRLPTFAEWNSELASWSTNNATGAIESPLKLPLAGSRAHWNGQLNSVGSLGYYLSSSISGGDAFSFTYASYLYFGSSFVFMASSNLADGLSVRCLGEEIVSGPQSYALDLTASPQEGGTVSGAGEYAEGAEVSIEATASAGYVFVNWSGDTGSLADTSQASTTVTMPAGPVALTANFELEDDNGDDGDWPRDTETAVVNVTNPVTGVVWMDRNLGASRAATSSEDAESYGDLYQWGRAADGHQKRTSPTTSTLSSTDTPGHGDFILAGSSPFDWRSPRNDNLWQGAIGTNNPCPAGYRLPTEAEWNAERGSWSSNNAAGAFASPLKLPLAGFRDGGSGSLIFVDSFARYWSSTLSGTDARLMPFSSSAADMFSFYRAYGFSVRCLREQTASIQVSQDFSTNWNLVGLPVDVEHERAEELFPTAIANTLFGFDGSYKPSATLVTGKGYWLRFAQATTQSFIGSGIDQIDVPVVSGWNLISGLSSQTVVDDMDQLVIPGTLYGFNGAYSIAASLLPARGYWIRTIAAGQLRLVNAPASFRLIPPQTDTAGFNEMVFTRNGTDRSLYFGQKLPQGSLPESYSLPPVPPSGAFDVRFDDDVWLTDRSEVTVHIQPSSEPTSVMILGNGSFSLSLWTDGLPGGQRLVMPGEVLMLPAGINRLVVRPDEAGFESSTLPAEYLLEQNFPNPFNPATAIRYALPEAGQVRLEVFTAAGQRVAVLAEGERAAGWHSATFEGGSLASGVYIYRLQAGGLVLTRKLLLMK
jgi:uncharacterized protein (TIGR02145 family)